MGTLRWGLAAVLMVVASGSRSGADWPQWRGPTRDGVAPAGPVLLDAWPEGGPPRLWQSEPIPSSVPGGYGSPVVADGRVYLYSNTRYREETPKRGIDDFQLSRLGYRGVKLPGELAARVEAARVGDERAGLSGKALGDWVSAWVSANLDEQQVKTFGSFVRDRLGRGRDAIGLEALYKLADAKGARFDTPDGLDRWLGEAGIAGDDRAAFLKVTPTTVELFADELFCLDAADGRTLWHRAWRRLPRGGEVSTTPAVAGGRVYFSGADSDVYCVAAADGTDVWRAKAGQGGSRLGSSVLVGGGAVFALAGEGLFAFDAAKGETLWEQPAVKSRESSPIVWTCDGRDYLVCNTARAVFLVEASDGKVVWSAPSSEMSTPVVSGERLVILTGTDLRAYRLSPEKPDRPLWAEKAILARGCSPVVHDGYVYATSRTDAVCVELATGRLAWQAKVAPSGYPFGAPVLADGKIMSILQDGARFVLFRATPEKFEPLASVDLKLVACSSPAVVGSRLYLRGAKVALCYDLAASAAR